MENGRFKILSDLIPTGDIEKDKYIIPRILDITLPFHNKNVNDIKRLKNYYYNKTDILSKQKVQQKEINNKIGVDYGQISVTTINAYCFANPLTFSSRNSNVEEDIKALNDALDDDNYAGKSMDMYLNAGICALGYRYVMPATQEQIENDIYFETLCNLDPEKTYCIYSNDLRQEKIMAVSFYDKKLFDENLRAIKNVTIYNVWTKYHQWEFYKKAGTWTNSLFYTLLPSGEQIEYQAYPLPYRKIPIIENVRKSDRTGDFELALDLINAINALASARLDDVEQSVDYIILLRDIDTESDGAIEKIKNAIKDGILSFKSIANATVQPDIDILDTKLNQSEVQTLQDFLCSKLEEVLNIPNRETRSSGGDTGSAVESRNGFRSLENIAGLVTANALKTENETLDVILAMCRNIEKCPFKNLKTRDVEIKENRNKVENLTNASNAYATLRNAGLNDIDALIATRIVSDPQSVAKKNKIEQEEKAEANLEQMKKQQEITNQGNTTKTENSQNSDNKSQNKRGSNSGNAEE
nr:MAG TPA: Portal [Caudoviricetes sp.]